ncbi:hypothetical protein DPEC_G00306730 [Dallia pectoralis]|uniref:Uncharacterized protein n=1 Tax=Dallia pectoralis TaxID=75939 RepID=A0ACC2FE71_DALPE|nr:hypothetical protein DPEC_G00306730 [Dallia pectoralis]
MFSVSLIMLLLAAFNCVHCEELTQPPSMTVQPGQPLTISLSVLRRAADTRSDSTLTMFSLSLLMLLAAVMCIHGQELTQPPSMTVQPGQPLTISCKVSYSVSGYGTSWIRQPAGKPLEWIGYIWTDGSTGYKDSLKNKFSITRDTSSNTLFLKGQSLQTEDTAVYYCARDPQ